MRIGIFLLTLGLIAAVPRAEQSAGDAARRRNLDQILDLYVRDGYVYYRALKADRRLLLSLIHI